MPSPASIIFLLLIAYWSPGQKAPIEIQHGAFATEAECDAAAARRNETWTESVHGGSTSWLCVGAFAGPST